MLLKDQYYIGLTLYQATCPQLEHSSLLLKTNYKWAWGNSVLYVSVGVGWGGDRYQVMYKAYGNSTNMKIKP